VAVASPNLAEYAIAEACELLKCDRAAAP